jgi:hypothetical protein
MGKRAMSFDRFNQLVGKLIERDGDHCSMCRTQFRHHAKTHYGTTRSGHVAVVGECCLKNLALVYAIGVYVSANAIGHAAGHA